MKTVKELLREKGFRNLDVCEILHLQPDTVCRKLKGTRRIWYKERVVLASLLGKNIEDIDWGKDGKK